MPTASSKQVLGLVKNTMSFSGFCALLGTPVKVVRTSWCAISSERHRAVFTVWADRLINGRYVFRRGDRPIEAIEDRRQGATELHRVFLTALEKSYETLGILCEAKDVTQSPRVRQRFREEELLVLRLVKEGKELVATVEGTVQTDTIIHGAIAQVSPLWSALDDISAPPAGVEHPDRVELQMQGYLRDNRVRNYVIQRAEGRCEYCGKEEFELESGGHYLETHHILRLSLQGPDTVENVIALCASHHCEAHYGKRAAILENEFLAKRRSQLR